MNVLILGNGGEERAWAEWLLASRQHRLVAAFPGFSGSSLADIPIATDLEDALARAGIDAAIVGGPIEERGENLRRAAAEGLAIVCLHPPGSDSEAYYQVALSRAETGAVIVPDLPLRLHPGVDSLQQAIYSGELGVFRGLRIELPCTDLGIDLARTVVPRCIDVMRALIGEIDALTATGDPPGERPDLELVVQLRAAESRRAELRTWSASGEPARLTLAAANGSLTLEFDPLLQKSCRLIRRKQHHGDQVNELDAWDPHAAIFAVLTASCAARQHGIAVPKLARCDASDGTLRGDRAQPAARANRRLALRADQRGIQLQIGDDVDRLHDPDRRARRRAIRSRRPTARLQLDDLHRLPDTADSGDLHGLANAAIRRPKARPFGRGRAAKLSGERG